MFTPPSLTRAEAIAAALVVAPAATVVAAYSIDWVGFSFAPWLMLGVFVASGAVTLRQLWRRAAPDITPLLSWSVPVVGVFGWLVWLSRPSWLPVGTGPDLTHHLLLIRYIDEHWHLVREPGVEAFLGEMAYYTPGSHLLASLAGRWGGTTGLHALHAVLAYTVALKVGFVVLISRRLLPESTPRDPLAVAAALTVFTSQIVFLGSFLEFAFVAQVVAELFVVFCWWTLSAWDQEPATLWLWMFGLSAAALFLTWPVLVGPPLLLLGILTLLPRPLPFARRAIHALIGGLPPLVYATLFTIGRFGWVQMAGTGGRTASPSVAAYGWAFLIASSAGALSLARQRSRSLGLMAASILTQAAVLYWFATSHHNTPYMALKMFYALLYVQAAGIAVSFAEVWSAATRLRGTRSPAGRATSPIMTIAAWGTALLVAALVVRSLVPPRRLAIHLQPAITRPLELAGEWARAHVPPQCVDYLVGDDEASYWLHLAVLGNPRMSARTGDNNTYDVNQALIRWLTPGGLPYAIADLPAMPKDVRDEFDVMASFGPAAVVKRRGPSTCVAR